MLEDFQVLSDCLEKHKDPTEILRKMELLAQFLSDTVFDSLWAASTASGIAIAGRRLMWMKLWKVEQAQRSLIHHLPFLRDVI